MPSLEEGLALERLQMARNLEWNWSGIGAELLFRRPITARKWPRIEVELERDCFLAPYNRLKQLGIGVELVSVASRLCRWGSTPPRPANTLLALPGAPDAILRRRVGAEVR